jgi:hypothetical protein
VPDNGSGIKTAELEAEYDSTPDKPMAKASELAY